MSDATPPTSDQQLAGEKILEEMARVNGGELVRDEGGRLRLLHPPPAPSR